MTYSEAREQKARISGDHEAYLRDIKAARKAKEIAAWLQANPSIGELVGKRTRYYRIVDGNQVMVKALAVIS